MSEQNEGTIVVDKELAGEVVVAVAALFEGDRIDECLGMVVDGDFRTVDRIITIAIGEYLEQFS